ncbi:MAG: SIMPL domain-containing protein [Lachnospiraceae bacterium]|nr:SIMPL domain-containing protein [Lachnospiraceae bacterium]
MEENKKENIGKQKGVIIALIAGVSLIICTLILTLGFLSYKSKSPSGGITATGSASCDFESDLIVWRGYFSTFGVTTQDAYQSIKNDSETIKQYLKDNGIKDDEMVFSSININQHYNDVYNEEGNHIGDELIGYDLYQDVCITSSDVDTVEKISRDISGLIESGIEFTSDSPEYYYTKLDELKLQLIADATENAKQRIDLIAGGTSGKAGSLSTASLGVFQITATNSADEEYSYGGTFNTSSREKTASITVKLNYNVK